MNKFLSILAVAFAMLIGTNVYAQSANNLDVAPAPAKQCAKAGGAAGCCKDKATAGATCNKGQATAATCTKGQATATGAPACTKGQATAAGAKCTGHGTSAMVQEGTTEVLSEKMTDKKAIKNAAKAKRHAKAMSLKAGVNNTATPACQKGAGAKCCKDKAAAGAANNVKVTEQK